MPGEPDYVALLEALPEPVLAVDDARRLIFANDAARRFLNFPVEQNGNGDEPWPGPAGFVEHPILAAMARAERGGEIVRVQRDTGAEAAIEVTAAVLPGGGAIGTIRDVTTRVRIEAELSERAAQLKALLDHLPVGVAYFDEQGVCRASNGLARKILGRFRGDAIGAFAADLFGHWPTLLAGVRRCIADHTPHVEHGVSWPNPSAPEQIHYLDWRFEPLSGDPNRASGALGLILDVTERQRAETQLQAAKDAAESAALNKTRFLSAISHDLRTPVNALSLQAELLARIVGLRPEPDTDLKGLASDLCQATSSLVELTNDLLDLVRFESGDIEYRTSEFGLEEWLAATLRPLELTATAKGIDFSWRVDQPGLVIRADRIKLGRVLTNLAGNAIKFTEQGSVVIEAGAADDGGLALRVVDTGPGIPADQHERIFDEFAQLRNPERDRSKGTGLGLAICRRLVDGVGGRLTVQSEPGAGSTFSAFFPPDHIVPGPPAPSPSSPEIPIPQPAKPPHGPILLVEDDSRSREPLARLLGDFGYQVEPVASGLEALELLERIRPALILLDLMLPGMDGVEILRRLRERPDWAGLPVVVLSGDVMGERVGQLQGLGVSCTLAKPIDLDAVLDAVARYARVAEVEPA